MSVPRLRFPGFVGEWGPAKAGVAFKNSRAKGQSGLPIYSVTLDRGLVPRDSLDRHMAADAADGANLRAQKGDLVYNMMRMWQGAVGIAPEECMVSPAYVVLAPKKETSSEFFDYWFKSSRMLYLLWAYSHGLTSDRLRLYFDDFAKIPINLPSLPEQKKIAAFLGVVDAKIAALRARVLGLETYKRGLMQALFSQRLRFTKPDGTAFPDWEEKRLGEVCEEPTYGMNAAAGTFDGKHKYIRITDIAEESRRYVPCPLTSPIGDIDGSYRLSLGDILFARTGASTGRSYLYRSEDGEIYFAGFLIRFRVNKANPNFVFYFTLTEAFQEWVIISSVRSGQPGINAREFASLTIPFPHPDEQAKIAEALSAMDAKIAAVQAQAAQMQDFKKGLLQQMFV